MKPIIITIEAHVDTSQHSNEGIALGIMTMFDCGETNGLIIESVVCRDRYRHGQTEPKPVRLAPVPGTDNYPDTDPA